MANNKIYNDYLMHGRTKGSRNGVSTTPGYVAKGKKAVGRLINGVYVYTNNVSAVNKQKALKAQADASYNKNQKFENRPAKYKYTNYGVDKLAKKAEQQARLMNEANTSYKKQQMLNSGNPANNWQQQGNYYRGISEYLDKKNANQEHAHQNASNQADAERAAREKAMAYASKTNATNSAAGAHQNAVDQANAERAALNTIGNRSSSKSAHQNAVNQANAERYGRDAAYWNSQSHKSFEDWKYNKQLEAKKKVGEANLATKAAKYESYKRNQRSDIENAYEDFKQDAKNTFKYLKSKTNKKKK